MYQREQSVIGPVRLCSSDSTLFQTMVGWYMESAELQALIEEIRPGTVMLGLGLGGESTGCVQVEALSTKLRMHRQQGGCVMQNVAAADQDETLLETLEDADMSTVRKPLNKWMTPDV
jgi:hypothetical protein